MKAVYVLNDNIITSLGFSTEENIQSIRNNTIGIRMVEDQWLSPSRLPLSLVDSERLTQRFIEVCTLYPAQKSAHSFTRLEKMLILSIHEAIVNQNINPADQRTILVLSSTKGNIDLLEDRHKMSVSHKRIYLWEMARVICRFFGFARQPIVISNACISGVVAIMTATRMLQRGDFDHAVVAGGDIASEFVISGFQSFQALSMAPCKPFDLNRSGLSLGEGCGTIVLSVNQDQNQTRAIRVAGASTTNDANHISGPSRTGEELSLAINQAMVQANVSPDDIDHIVAHGTATSFNDEMEGKAIGLSLLNKVPVNSLKGYWGHTLGAAGLIESVAAIASMRDSIVFKSAGYESPGVSTPLNVLTRHRNMPVNVCLKTASGFGGCNAAVIFKIDA